MSMPIFPLKPSHKPVKDYYAALAQFQLHGHTTEGNTRSAFADLLKRCCSPYDWHLVEEYQFRGTSKQPLRADGALIDQLTLQHGIWEAKDSSDDLQKEVKAKVAKGYPLTNTLFQSPDRAVLYQDSRIAWDGPITEPEALVEVLALFFEHQQADIPDWKDAVDKFSLKIKDLAGAIKNLLVAEDKRNTAFRDNFESFAELCRQSINPELSDDAIRNMLVQHLLTERIFRKIFNNSEFLKRNVIAAEIEKVIASITLKHFSRDEFLKSLDHFYKSIERAAESQTGYTEKQHFLNAVYEKFFQNFDEKQADTHGIVYTPQSIVDFMVRSVDEILQQEFGRTLSDKGVHILDPFTGTGNFITRIMQQIKRSALPQKYAEELHCNEIMLLPYYIASMNIEHAYMEKVGEYRPFEGICLVDTFELAEPEQSSLGFMGEENSARVKREKDAPIFIVIGNPPYNIGQSDENDDNQNRKYPEIDRRIAKTFAKDSRATLTNSLFDPYIRAYRWAMDRIGEEGVIAFVTNSGFIDGLAADGVRKHLAGHFDSIYVLDLGGNVRKNPRLSGSTHNVFGIQVGVSINIFVRHKSSQLKDARIFSASATPDWTRFDKYRFLEEAVNLIDVPWSESRANSKGDWFPSEGTADFDSFIAMGSKEAKRGAEPSIFSTYCNGQKSNSDEYVYSFSLSVLEERANTMVQEYCSELDRWKRTKRREAVENFIKVDVTRLKWIRQTKRSLSRGTEATFDNADLRRALYRPFVACYSYFNPIFNEDLYRLPNFFPAEVDNHAIAVSMTAERPFTCLATKSIPNLVAAGGFGCTTQVFPFHTLDEEGLNRRENITDVALAEFGTHYADKKITKWDIFHATYAVLHHPEYRIRYAANLKRELPRIPFPPDLHAFAAAGKRLMELHIDYEKQPEYPLEQIEDPKAEVTFRVERMRLNAKDKSELRYNDFLTLRGIPLAAYDYRLGNRSALEWVIDQYRVSTDTRSGIVNDPNREDDPQYILRLIGQVITVSLETQQIIANLPSLMLGTS